MGFNFRGINTVGMQKFLLQQVRVWNLNPTCKRNDTAEVTQQLVVRSQLLNNLTERH
jgi:hypothetical protein